MQHVELDGRKDIAVGAQGINTMIIQGFCRSYAGRMLHDRAVTVTRRKESQRGQAQQARRDATKSAEKEGVSSSAW
ncbi:hypothetical protein GHA01_22280 [Novacetimonas hansenii]|uniref:Uncharacterized protein n=1 Tax=Novacetimonas hansenii TaxID=436 RepID=A0ABQ0SGB8_NOVHA|nr:hypothetical protein GHA01_22280 [Novacetimonas hansenii]